MTVDQLQPAEKPTFYFIGVTTSQSSIMRVFPRWMSHLGREDVQIVGVDCQLHDNPETYRRIVRFIKSDPLSVGGLVTTHKMDLLEAASELFDGLDPYARMLGEISSLSKVQGSFWGHAKDPISSGLAYDAIVPVGHWVHTQGELCLLGAGGSSLALTSYLMKQKPSSEWPKRLVVTNRSQGRLDHMREVHRQINPGLPVEYVLAASAQANDAVVGALKPGSLVVNATGLGKDAEGSPLSDQVCFPQNGLVWEYNYRGQLRFMEQAQAQQGARSLTIEDGWVYFIHGWTRVIAEVLNLEIPTTGPGFEKLCEIAATCR